MNNYIVQMHRNKINGKVYIGQSSLDNINRRFRGGCGYKSSPYFYAAIQKYGWENFEHIILEANISEEEIDEKERYQIKLYQSLNPEYGYNLKPGGRSKPIGGKTSNYNKKRVRCVETGKIQESLSAACKDYGFNVNMANNISSQAKGQRSYAGKDPITGQPLHWEFVDNITENKPPLIPKKGGALPVKCLETGKTYDSINEAARDSGMSVPTITKSCRSNGEIGVSKNVKKELRIYTHWIYI